MQWKIIPFWQIFAVLQKIKNSNVVKHLGTWSTHTKAQKWRCLQAV